ncbi:MAG TPA: sugar ABC transporter substrate-binding protein [Anaerolineae bacterium]|nr:sugar ABC transporter substrate-binding protein [Anaerolineae bacterium]
MKMSKQMTRREFLKASVMVTGGLTLSSALAACALPAAPPPGAPTAVPAKPKKAVFAIQSFAHDALKPILQEFTDRTGIEVALESMPSSGTDALTKLTTYYSSGSSPYDVVSDSDESAPAFMRAGWLEPLDDVIPAETWADFPDSMKGQIEVWHSFEGKKYRVPHEFAMGYFWYRKDWFDEKNMQPPTTWDEMVSIGKEFTDPDKGIWATEDALAKPALLYVYMAYMTIQAGGEIFSFDEGTAKAFQFVYDMMYTHKIFPDTALNKNYDQINEDYLNDRIAFMRQWPYFWSVTRGAKDWYAEGKAEIALPPAGPAGSRSWVGGWGFTVPKYAPNKDAAFELIRFLTSNEIAPKLAKANSWFLMPRKSIMAVMGNEGLAVYMKQYSDAGVPYPRPFHPKVAEAQNVVDDVASLYLSKQISLAEAMKQGKERIAALG